MIHQVGNPSTTRHCIVCHIVFLCFDFFLLEMEKRHIGGFRHEKQNTEKLAHCRVFVYNLYQVTIQGSNLPYQPSLGIRPKTFEDTLTNKRCQILVPDCITTSPEPFLYIG